jgi:WG repeat protein
MSTRILAWLAFAGWVIPFLAMGVCLSMGPNESRPIVIVLVLIAAGLFLAGLAGSIERFRYAPRTRGLWTAGASHLLGSFAVATLMGLSIKTSPPGPYYGQNKINAFGETRASLWKTEEVFGFRDQSGKILISPRFEFAFDFQDGLGVVLLNGLWGAIDERGGWAIRPEYEKVSVMSEGRLAVRRDKQWGFVDRSGRLVIPHRFEDAQYYSEGVAAIKLGGKWGFIDTGGKITVEPRYDAVSAFHGGLAAVNIGGVVQSTGNEHWHQSEFKGGRWGYVDPSGVQVIEAGYLKAEGFQNGRADVVDDQGPAVIDRAGRIIERPKLPE